jgi:hypothetical protein
VQLVQCLQGAPGAAARWQHRGGGGSAGKAYEPCE